MIIEIVNEYDLLRSKVDTLIELSGYKIKYIAEQLGITPTTLYRKRKSGDFTVKEVKTLAELFDKQDLEDKIFGLMIREASQDELATEEDTMRMFLCE